MKLVSLFLAATALCVSANVEAGQPDAVGRSGLAPTFVGCSETEQLTVERVLPTARSSARRAHKLLERSKRPSTDERVRAWFGPYSVQRYATATATFRDIETVLYGQTLTFDCGGDGCHADDVAYVAGDATIHLCGRFWERPRKGFDSQAGTLVHEVSHLAAGTNSDTPEVHGYPDLQPLLTLATTHPWRAVRNAASYQHFAESFGIPSSFWLGSGGTSLCGTDEGPAEPTYCCSLCGNRAGYELVEAATCGDCAVLAQAYCDEPGLERGLVGDASILALAVGSSDQCQSPSDLCAVECVDGARYGRVEGSACRCAADADLCAPHGGAVAVSYGGVDVTVGDPCAPLPTNGLIAYSERGAGGADIFTIQADGKRRKNFSALVPAGPGGSSDITPSWAPDGGRIAFVRHSFSGTHGIVVVNSDGSGFQMVTSGNFDWYPSWAPDGRRIVFVRHIGEPPYPRQLVIVDLDTLEEEVLLSTVTDDVRQPRWSPDGTKIAFRLQPFGVDESEIRVIGPDGSGSLRLSDASDGGIPNLPVWFPDGSKLTYRVYCGGACPDEIYRTMEVTPDGLSRAFRSGPAPLAWAPDGTALVTYEDQHDSTGLAVATPDGSNWTTLRKQILEGLIGMGVEGPSWQTILLPVD